MPADWSLGNFLSYNDPWAQDYGNKRFAHCETTGGLALFAVHMEGHMNTTMWWFKRFRDRNQGRGGGASRRHARPRKPPQIWARLACATRSRHLFCFRLSAGT
jgi:hypothetical protein